MQFTCATVVSTSLGSASLSPSETKLPDRYETPKHFCQSDAKLTKSSHLCWLKSKVSWPIQINLNPSLLALRFWSARVGLGSTVTPSSSAPSACLCSPLLRLPPAARVSGQMAAGRGICRRRRLVPPHRAETGVICRTISIFMNSVRVQTASSSRRLWLGRLQPQ